MMAPPEPRETSPTGEDGAAPAVPFAEPMTVLRKRAEFLAASRGRRQVMPAFVLQARRRGEDEPPVGIRVGYTCSKKVGNAVARNRAKRRLREAARAVLPRTGHAGWDYVLIGRRDETANRSFAKLLTDLETAVARIHAQRGTGQ